MPRAKKPLLAVSCANCGTSFQTTREDARFCPAPEGVRNSPCQVAFGNRMAARGKVLAPYVLAWVAGRGGGHSGTDPVAAKAMKELTSIARDFIDEDKKKGRPPVLDYVGALFDTGFLYCDRRR